MSFPEALRRRWSSLAPLELANWRDDRFDGSGLSVAVAELAGKDRRVIEVVYAAVLEIAAAEDDATRQGALECLVAPPLMREVESLGAASLAAHEAGETRAALRRALHDIRSGGLTCLVGYGRLIPRVELSRRQELVARCGTLARDHAKMMRNALHDLDPAVRSDDSLTRAHPVLHFVSAVDGLRLAVGGGLATVEAASESDAWVTARCLEASALERVLYNLLNNAGRFHADGRVQVGVLELGPLLRWVVENRITDDQQRWLESEVGGAAGELFLGGHSRGGEGSGLESSAEIVRRAFGLDDREAAVRGGYVGARAVEGRFTAWFHWPIYDPPEGVERCSC